MRAKILVVDDDTPLRSLVKNCLALDGHDVQEAQTGVETLAHIAQHDLDLILLDLRTSQVNAAALLPEIRKRDTIVGVLLVRALLTVDGHEGIIELGGDGHLWKPYDLDELQQQVATVLERVAQRRSASLHAQ